MSAVVPLLFALWASSPVAPKPVATWQVPFSVEVAAVQNAGASVFFDGQTGYFYDVEGVLQESFQVTESITNLYLAPGDVVLATLASGVLAALTETGHFRWQKSMAAPSLPPLQFQDLLLYPMGTQLLLIDPADGSSRFSLNLEAAASSVHVVGSAIWVAESTGSVRVWEPGKGQTTREMGSEVLDFVTLGPQSQLVALYDGGRMEVLRPNQKRVWQRHAHIDYAAPPLAVPDHKGFQVLVATRGRNFFAFDGARGRQIQRVRLDGRPIGQFPLPGDFCLVVIEQVPELVWYHVGTHTLIREKRVNPIVSFAISPQYLLLVDEKGIMMLYQR